MPAQADQVGVAENVFNSQESVLTDDGGEKAMEVEINEDAGKMNQDEESLKDDQPERRRIDRLKKEVHLTTMEKNEAMVRRSRMALRFCSLESRAWPSDQDQRPALA